MSDISVWKLCTNQPSRLVTVEFEPHVETLDEVSRRLPGGAYTTFRTYHLHEAHHMQAHLNRLQQSAAQVCPSLRVNLAAVRQAAHTAVLAGEPVDKRVRLTIDLENNPGDVYIITEPLKVPSPQSYQNGVDTRIRRLDRETPKAKLTSFITVADQVRNEITNGVNEVLMVDERGRILEGLSSNFFAVYGGELYTAEVEVLSGITREIVIEEARLAGISLRLEPIAVAQIEDLDEAFITSSSRGVLPVTYIEGNPVKNGRPGIITGLLLERYERRIAAETEPI